MNSRSFTDEEIQDLTDRVYLLQEKVNDGKLKIADHLIEGFRSSFMAIRFTSDGLVDPNTVDGKIRSLTLAIRGMKYREETKQSISLADIQESYFKILETNFGELFVSMQKAKTNPHHIADFLSRKDDFVDSAIASLSDLTAIISEFWQSVGDAGIFHLQDSRQLKASFSGDIFPAYWENVVSTAGLYVDTIVLPCPIIRVAPIAAFKSPREVTYLLIKHVLTAMTYRTIATASLDQPIVVVMPDNDEIFDVAKEGLVSRSLPATLAHGEYLFDRKFESKEHLFDFLFDLETADQVFSEIKQPKRLVFNTEWNLDPKAQLERTILEDQNGTNKGFIEHPSAGARVLEAFLGRLPQAMAAIDKSNNIGGTPLISVETSWLYFTWTLEYNAKSEIGRSGDLEQMHVVHALSSEANTNLEWLGNVPPETVLEIRRQGHAEEIRRILSNGISELVNTNPKNYFRTADQVVENIDRAFEEHQLALADAKKKKLRLYGIDVASCLATGGIGIAAAVTSNPTLGSIAAVASLAGGATFKDIKSKFKEIADEDRKRAASPTGLLFRHLN